MVLGPSRASKPAGLVLVVWLVVLRPVASHPALLSRDYGKMSHFAYSLLGTAALPPTIADADRMRHRMPAFPAVLMVAACGFLLLRSKERWLLCYGASFALLLAALAWGRSAGMPRMSQFGRYRTLVIVLPVCLYFIEKCLSPFCFALVAVRH